MELSKIFIALLLTIAINTTESQEVYKVMPSPRLKRQWMKVNRILAKSLEYVVEDDFYLTNITRIIYYITIALADKGYDIQMKAMLRERVEGYEDAYINYLYIYFNDESR